uniref:Uncharacterized protein n=1 Tax=Helianthus annuus TaxID=4232 RepID=A0A251V980_HELAN
MYIELIIKTLYKFSCNLYWGIAFEFYKIIVFFTSNSVPFGWNLGGWGRTHGYSLNQRV